MAALPDANSADAVIVADIKSTVRTVRVNQIDDIKHFLYLGKAALILVHLVNEVLMTCVHETANRKRKK